jgi:hypothetical protein
LAPHSEQSLLPSSILFDWKVDFLHRTVRDFLMLEETRRLLQRWCSPGFDPNETICKALLAQIKTAPEEREYWDIDQPISRLYAIFKHHFYIQSSQDHQPALIKLRENLNAVLDLRKAKFERDEAGLEDEEKECSNTPPSGRISQVPEFPRDRVVKNCGRNFQKLFGKLHKKVFKKS